MATRCAIVKQNENGTFHAVYSHWDGYPSGVGQQIVNWTYGLSDDRRKYVFEKLLAEKIGWSVLAGTDIDLEPAWREHGDPETDAPLSYTARGEKRESSQTYNTLSDIAENTGAEYLYLVNADYSKLSIYKVESSDVAQFLGDVSLVPELPSLRKFDTL